MTGFGIVSALGLVAGPSVHSPSPRDVAERVHVRTRTEAAAGSGDHDGAHAAIGGGAVEEVEVATTHLGTHAFRRSGRLRVRTATASSTR